MGLRSIFQNAAETIFDVFGDIATAATYTSKGIKSYDATTGGSTATDTSELVDMIFEHFQSFEIDNKIILATDRKVLIPNNDLTAIPKARDIVSINGIDWGVLGLMDDPAEALHILHLRKP